MPTPVRITFLGGAGAIGASSALVQVAGLSLLVDAGVRFQPDRPLPDFERLTGIELDAIVVTHAHTDHTGGLPVVHDAYRAAPILMTPPTRDLVAVLQRDALRIMQGARDAEDELPLYSERQVQSMVERIRPVHHGESTSVGDVEITFLPAGHILGASMVHLRTPGGDVLFSGDYSVTEQRTVGRMARPDVHVDIAVSEATYGNRLHADRSAAEKRLLSTLGEVLEQGGRVLIPAFAIGRAQEVLLLLKHALRTKALPPVAVFVDGMVRSVCGVYSQHERYASATLAREMRLGHPFFGDSIQPVKSPKDRKAVLDAGPCVIVSSSGMLRGGPSALYAAALAPRAEDAILITGYQDEESPGRALLRLAQAQGPRRLRLGTQEVEVRCRFETYSLSAHADRSQMVSLLEDLGASTVVLVHGDADAKDSLARNLAAREIVLADDGMQLERAYSGRPKRKAAPPGAVASASAASAPTSSAPPPATVPSPSLGGSDGSSPDLESLKKQNPKGRLLELVARLRLRKPALELLAQPNGAGFVAEMRMHDPAGRLLRSGPHRAGDRKTAEQLAARALLAHFETASGAPSPRCLDEGDEEHLKAVNPKGRLLERCMRRKLAPPTFEHVAVPEGFRGRARMLLPTGEVLISAEAFARSRKALEQAACADLLAQLGAPGGAPGGVLEGTAPLADEPRDGVPTDPRPMFNDWRQTGRIAGFGFELLEQRGPAHAPVFVVRAWLERPDGSLVQTPPMEAATKRQAEIEAARSLWTCAQSA